MDNNARVRSGTVGAIAVILLLGGARVDTALAQFDPGDRGTPGDLEPGGTRAVEFTPPDRGTPGALEPGGTRARAPFEAPFPIEEGLGSTRGCTVTNGDDREFAALVPDTPETIGVTTQEYPTVYAYVPETDGKVEVEFTLSDKDYNDLYTLSFEVDSRGEIIPFQLPRSVNLPPLPTQEPYLWSVTLICNPADPAANSFVEGWIGRFQPTETFVSDLSSGSGLTKAALYADAGVWYEAIDTLAQLRQANPNNAAVQEQWENLLRSVGLEDYADAPLRNADD